MAKLLLAVLAMVAVVPAAFAAAPTPLDSFLDDMKTLRATFLQTLVDAHGREIDRSNGTLIVVRPGKFRWEIHPQGGGAGSGAGARSSTGAGASAGAAAGGSSGAGGGQLRGAD